MMLIYVSVNKQFSTLRGVRPMHAHISGDLVQYVTLLALSHRHPQRRDRVADAARRAGSVHVVVAAAVA
jgi:hypothetical protein